MAGDYVAGLEYGIDTLSPVDDEAGLPMSLR
jgi:hypothetical protein